MTAKQKRALSHVGGSVELVGTNEAERSAIVRALAVESDEATPQPHVHGFHSYPARLHPGTAAALLDAFGAPDTVVLDPFCGSGTVVVEARLRGLRVAGSDVNPLSIALTKLKTSWDRPRVAERIVTGAARVSAFAEDRRARKAGATRRFPPADVELFEPHVLLELDGLVAGIDEERDKEVAQALALVVSAILIKVSRQAGDSGQRRFERRLASGFTIRLFEQKAKDLATRLDAAGSVARGHAPRARLLAADARRLGHIPRGAVDLVITSPPYAGVYDYYSHHAARLRWLGMKAKPFEAREIGSRRSLVAEPDGVLGWERDVLAVLRELSRVLAPVGRIAIVTADSAIGDTLVVADQLFVRLAPKAGLSVSTVGSQTREHFHQQSRRAFGGRRRREHLIVLGRVK